MRQVRAMVGQATFSEDAMLTIPLPDEVERRLETLARETGHSARFHAERASTEYFGDLEDYRAAEREVEALRVGRSASVPLDELMKSSGLSR